MVPIEDADLECRHRAINRPYLRSVEVVHIPTFVATPEDRARGAKLFGSLRVTDVQTNLMGETRAPDDPDGSR